MADQRGAEPTVAPDASRSSQAGSAGPAGAEDQDVNSADTATTPGSVTTSTSPPQLLFSRSWENLRSWGRHTTPPSNAHATIQGHPHLERLPTSQDSKDQHVLSVEMCDQILNSLHDPANSNDLERQFKNLIRYKDTWLEGQLLHYAIWKSCKELQEKDAALVKSVLEAKADVRGKASYVKRGNTNVLEAVHLAAGLGSVPVLQVLIDHSENAVDIVSAECYLGGEFFYRPIHDAAFNGRKDTLVWLLENRADASAVNIDHKSPLHFLAQNGLKNEKDLEDIVESLLVHRAQLDQRTKHRAGDIHGGKLCLELASGSDSQYPRRLLHLLMPSFQDEEKYSVFEDLRDVASLNTDAANQLAKQLTGDAIKAKRVRRDAQRKNAVDSVARLFHMAPEAAAELLGVMMHRPLVQEVGHHAIPTRTNLWGLFKSRQMRCEYQDAAKRSDDLRVPLWQYDSTKAKDQQPEIEWHERLVPMPGIQEEQREYIDDVETMVVLLPNILDIDIFMALAYTGDDSSGIFGRLAVQGIITCLWDQLIRLVVHTRLVSNLIDILAMATWGLTQFPADKEKEETNSPVQSPLLYSIVMAGMLRDSVHFIMWISSHHRKWRRHFNEFQQWEREGKDSQSPPGLHSLWRPQAFFSINNRAVLDLLIVVLKAFFIMRVSDQAGRAMSDVEQALLTTCAIVQFHRLMYMMRLSEAGKHVSTIISACCSTAIRDMMLVTLMFYACALLALKMLRNQKSMDKSTEVELYLGLLFGDGDALKFMGLDPEESMSSSMRSCLMLGATLVFHIVILNLTTAVYSNEYDRLQKEEENTFFRERSKCCTELLLSGRLPRFRAWTATTPDATEEAGTATTTDATKEMRVQIGAALVLFVAIHCASSSGSTMSMTSWSSWLALLVSACSLALAMVSIQAYLVASPWFPERSDGEEGPEKEHFLWICYRAKLKEDQAAEASQSQLEVELDNRLGSLERSVNEQVAKFEHLERHVSNVDGTLADMAKKMERLLEQQDMIAANLRPRTQT